jgi:hypothetical protein
MNDSPFTLPVCTFFEPTTAGVVSDASACAGDAVAIIAVDAANTVNARMFTLISTV